MLTTDMTSHLPPWLCEVILTHMMQLSFLVRPRCTTSNTGHSLNTALLPWRWDSPVNSLVLSTDFNYRTWFDSLPLSLSLSGCVTESGLKGAWLAPLWKPQGCNKRCWCAALCFDAPRIQRECCFRMTKPCWQNKTKTIPGNPTLEPSSIYLYLCAFPRFCPSSIPHIPPTPNLLSLLDI